MSLGASARVCASFYPCGRFARRPRAWAPSNMRRRVTRGVSGNQQIRWFEILQFELRAPSPAHALMPSTVS
jgi:hypothetical protein